MKHFTLLLLLSLVLCIQLSLGAHHNKYKCPKNMNNVRCSDQFQGVCAFFEDSSCENLSQKYSANQCIACLDSRVKYVIAGACTADKVFCDANVRPEFCTREYFPVCGYNSKCQGDNCGISAGNKCMACANSKIEWYIQGECPQAEQTNDTDDSTSTDNNNTGNDSTDDSGSGEDSTENGSSGDSSDVANEVLCDPNNRPNNCTDIDEPACARVPICSGTVCTVTPQNAANACRACQYANVNSYVPGECPPVVTKCDPKNRPQTCDVINEPVCGTLQTCYRNNCTETTETFGNDCLACGNTDVISYIPGECPEDTES